MGQVENNIPTVTLEKKVGFLSKPETYTEHPEEVIAKETHMSWVFLTNTHAYKLKKPVQYSFLDFSTLEARHKDCKEEVRLNRRLAEEVYLGIVPLTLDGWGQLHLGGEGEVIDWLVKMRRLPEVLMLDYLMQYHLIPEEELRQSAEILAAFYKTQPPADIKPAAYCSYLEENAHHNFHELTRFDFYKSYRAVLRALLAMRHTLETNYRHDHVYQQQAQQYLKLAEKYVQNL